MLANFSQEEIVLPKASVVGVAEAISPCVVAEINDRANPSNTPCFTNGKRTNKNRNATAEVKCREYLDSVLGHLTRKERAVMEPVLRQYRHVFHDEDGADLKALISWSIESLQARPNLSEKLNIEYHTLLGRKWKAKLGTCSRRESLNLAILRGILRPSLCLRNQLTAGLSIASVWTSVL